MNAILEIEKKEHQKPLQERKRNPKTINYGFLQVFYTSVLFYCTFKSFCSLLNIFLCLHNTTDVTGSWEGRGEKGQISRSKFGDRSAHGGHIVGPCKLSRGHNKYTLGPGGGV